MSARDELQKIHDATMAARGEAMTIAAKYEERAQALALLVHCGTDAQCAHALAAIKERPS